MLHTLPLQRLRAGDRQLCDKLNGVYSALKDAKGGPFGITIIIIIIILLILLILIDILAARPLSFSHSCPPPALSVDALWRVFASASLFQGDFQHCLLRSGREPLWMQHGKAPPGESGFDSGVLRMLQ